MNKQSKIYIAGHRGLVGSAIVRELRQEGYTDLLTATSKELDLREQADTRDFFEQERPDYVFLDPRINDYHRLLTQIVRPWIHGEGLSYQLNYAWDELETVCRLVRGIDGVESYRNALRSLTKESNERLFQLVEDSSIAFEGGDDSFLDPEIALTYCDANIARLIDLRNRFIADNIYLLRDASSADCTAGPVIAPQVH